MDASTAINDLTNKVVDSVNHSHLHPAIVRLVLLNVLHAVEEQERQIAAGKEAQPDADHG